MAQVSKYFRTSSSCGRVCLLAAPFGYGPRVSAEQLARLLNLNIGTWQQCSTRDADIVSGSILLLNFEVQGVKITDRNAPFRVWVDCLLWLRQSLPLSVFDHEMVIAQAFFPIRNDYLSMPNLHLTSPLVDFGEMHEKRIPPVPPGYILVSFGGIETPYTEDIHRRLIPSRVLEAVSEAVDVLADPRQIVCCAPQNLCQQLRQANYASCVHFLSPSHQEYMCLLRGATLNIIQPGLFGPFEAFAARVPTVFCPPFSYTQLCQARKYEEYGLLGEVPLWSMLDTDMTRYEGELNTEEPSCFKAVASWLRQNLNCGEHRDIFFNWAKKAVEGSLATPELINKRAKYVESCASLPAAYISLLTQLLG